MYINIMFRHLNMIVCIFLYIFVTCAHISYFISSHFLIIINKVKKYWKYWKKKRYHCVCITDALQSIPSQYYALVREETLYWDTIIIDSWILKTFLFLHASDSWKQNVILMVHQSVHPSQHHTPIMLTDSSSAFWYISSAPFLWKQCLNISPERNLWFWWWKNKSNCSQMYVPF